MMHFFPDGDGGFFGYDDPVLDFEGGAILIVIAAISITAIIVPFATSPDLLSDSIACLLVGGALVGLSFGRGGLPFLRPLALPFFVYFLASSSYTMLALSGEFGLLMWPILGFYLIFAGLGLFGAICGEDAEGVMTLFTLGFGAPIWFTSLAAGLADYQEWLGSTFMFYLMRVALVIALVWAAVIFIMWVLAIFKGEVHLKSIAFTALEVVIGVVPLFVGGAVAGLFSDGLIEFVGLLAVVAVYALAGWFTHILAQRLGEEASIFALLIPLLLVGATGFLRYANFQSHAEFLVMLRPLASSSFLVSQGFAASQLAADAVGMICSGVVWAFTSIFDLASFAVEAPMHIGYIALIILAAVGVGVGQDLELKLPTKS